MIEFMLLLARKVVDCQKETGVLYVAIIGKEGNLCLNSVVVCSLK